jgi:hypothetical protein
VRQKREGRRKSMTGRGRAVAILLAPAKCARVTPPVVASFETGFDSVSDPALGA